MSRPVADSLFGALAAAMAAFDDAGVAAVVVGGVAVSLLGKPRFTRDIDVILGGLPFARSAVANSRPRSVGELVVRLPRVEDLMIMKAVAQRPQDLLDLEGLIAAHPEADLTVVRQWVREFSAAAAMPSLLEEFDRLARRLRG